MIKSRYLTGKSLQVLFNKIVKSSGLSIRTCLKAILRIVYIFLNWSLYKKRKKPSIDLSNFTGKFLFAVNYQRDVLSRQWFYRLQNYKLKRSIIFI
jgi:hypothetical protein